jgi:hypothetical protein
MQIGTKRSIGSPAIIGTIVFVFNATTTGLARRSHTSGAGYSVQGAKVRDDWHELAGTPFDETPNSAIASEPSLADQTRERIVADTDTRTAPYGRERARVAERETGIRATAVRM